MSVDCECVCGKGEVTVILGLVCDSLTVCLAKGRERGTVVCCSGWIEFCASVSHEPHVLYVCKEGFQVM